MFMDPFGVQLEFLFMTGIFALVKSLKSDFLCSRYVFHKLLDTQTTLF